MLRRIGLIRRQEQGRSEPRTARFLIHAAKSLCVSGWGCTIVQAVGRNRKFPLKAKRLREKSRTEMTAWRHILGGSLSCATRKGCAPNDPGVSEIAYIRSQNFPIFRLLLGEPKDSVR